MRFIKFAVLAALFAVPSSSADAGILSSALTFNGQADQINTINNPVGRSTFVDGSNANNVMGELDAGDIVYGWIGSTQVTNDIATSNPFNPANPVDGTPPGDVVPFGGDNYLAAVFSGVVNDGDNPGETFLTAVDPTAGTGFSIPELLGDFSDVGEQLDGVNNAIAAVVTGSTTGGVNDLVNSSASDLSTFFDDASFDLEFALTADDGFYQSQFFPSLGQAAQRAGLNVIAGTESGGFTDPFIDVPVEELFSPSSVDSADVALDNTFVALSAPQNGYAFTVQSSSIRLNAVPEPSSALTFVGIGLFVFVRRRNK